MTEKENNFLKYLITALNKTDAALLDFKVDAIKTIWMKRKLEIEAELLKDIIRAYLDHFEPERKGKAMFEHLLHKHNVQE